MLRIDSATFTKEDYKIMLAVSEKKIVSGTYILAKPLFFHKIVRIELLMVCAAVLVSHVSSGWAN